jgi:two-component system, sensor histidine kinase PdtaS
MGLGAAIAAPLISRGRVVGVLNLYRKSTSRFADTDLHLLMSLANTAAVAIENANLWHEAQQRSEFVTAMLSEVNHRMRNSLQSVAGLLRMELERPQARSAEEVVRRAVTHVQSVAAVHEVLREQDLQFVDMKEVALRVARISHRGGRERAVDIEVTGARVMLPSQKAISVAQLLNELLDNALRHGLVGQEGGKVFVSLAEVGGEVVLQVRDTGVGAPGGVVPEDSPGLGLKIVRGLVEELGGRVEFEGRQGFTVRIRFPKLD